MKIEVSKNKSEKILEITHAIYKIFPECRMQIRNVLARAKDGITLEIKPTSKPRTRQQEKYYWMWVRQFADFCGNTPDEMHDHLLSTAFGSERIETPIGMVTRPQVRSSKLSIAEYTDLIETLIRVSAELGFQVPPPIGENFDVEEESFYSLEI